MPPLPPEVQQISNWLIAIGVTIIALANWYVHFQSKKKPKVFIVPPKDILYLEDDLGDITTLMRIFKKAGIINKLVSFTTAEELILFLRDVEPNKLPMLIFSDARVMANEYSLLESIRAAQKGRPLPIALITSKPEDLDMYQHGVVCHLSKPITIGQVVECLGLHGFVWEIHESRASV
jgi:CheY-like chemotaxis protein